MKTYRKTVFVSHESAAKDYDVKALDDAVKTWTEISQLKVTVKLSTDGKGYELTGDARAIDPDDDFDKADEQLALDLGKVKRVTEKEPFPELFPAGSDINMFYCLNHDGLPLAYNGAIRETFAKERLGRVFNPSEAAIAGVMVATGMDRAAVVELLRSK